MSRPLMKCGCVASAHFDNGSPVCPVHECSEVASERPSLEGRFAECAYGGARVPSSYDLAFFEYQGPGSPRATEHCKCGYYRVAHEYNANRVNKEPIKCRVGGFKPAGPSATDKYYCGCHGWD